MPKLPDDQDAARAFTDRQRTADADRAAKGKAAAEHDEAIIRQFANELRAKAGEPPLRPDEPVQVIICRRGRR